MYFIKQSSCCKAHCEQCRPHPAETFAQYRGGGVDAGKGSGRFSVAPCVLCESVKLFWELKHKCAFGLTPTLFLGGPSWGGQVYQYLKRAQPS